MNPVHKRAEVVPGEELTRCGLFLAGLAGRVSDTPTCADCLAEGPAAAYVTLPDGRIIERRAAMLTGYPYGVAERRPCGWVLRYWADSENEADFLAGVDRPGRPGYRRRKRAEQDKAVLPVQFAGSR